MGAGLPGGFPWRRRSFPGRPLAWAFAVLTSRSRAFGLGCPVRFRRVRFAGKVPEVRASGVSFPSRFWGAFWRGPKISAAYIWCGAIGLRKFPSGLGSGGSCSGEGALPSWPLKAFKSWKACVRARSRPSGSDAAAGEACRKNFPGTVLAVAGIRASANREFRPRAKKFLRIIKSAAAAERTGIGAARRAPPGFQAAKVPITQAARPPYGPSSRPAAQARRERPAYRPTFLKSG